MPGATKPTSTKPTSGATTDAALHKPADSDTRTLRERYLDVRARVARAAAKTGRRESEIVLVAVTKYAPIEAIRELVALGHIDLGENRVQQLMQRAAIIEEFQARRRERGADAPPVRWHMIGSLQRNKVKKAIELSRLIHSVDSLRLAEEIQDVAAARAGDEHPPVDVLIEVNVAGERSKHGVAPAAARHLVDMIDTMVALRPRGLMCMAPTPKAGEAPNLDDARRTFVRCKELFDEIRAMRPAGDRFDILSMGMSHDFEVAIECGANVVRVGSAIFGDAPETPGDTHGPKSDTDDDSDDA